MTILAKTAAGYGDMVDRISNVWWRANDREKEREYIKVWATRRFKSTKWILDSVVVRW